MTEENRFGVKKTQLEDMGRILEQVPELEAYKHCSVFITGATGFLGKTLVKTLAYLNDRKKTGIQIIAAVRDRRKGELEFEELLKAGRISLYVNDIVNPVQYEKPVDYIFHTASVTASKTMVEHPVKTIHTAYQGTKNILDFAVEKAVKGVVYLSSMEVYGSPDVALETVKESDLGYIDLMNVRSSYSEGKRICECLCTAYYTEFHVPVKIARLAQTFGAGVLESDNRVYAQFARSVINKKDIVLHSDGTSEGNYCYISDAVAALLLLGIKGKSGEPYNVVNEATHMQIREMAELVAEMSDKAGAGMEEKGDSDADTVFQAAPGRKTKVVFDIPESALKYGYAPPVRMKLSSEKIRKLGWNPQVGLREAYERMMADMESY